MKRLVLACAIAGLVGASLSVQAQQAPVDIILTNGKIITVDAQFSIAQAVAIRGDRIAAVGTNQEITKLAGPNTRRIDLRGRSVVPGFIDNHAHFQEEGAYWTIELRLDGVDSRKQALEMIRAKAQAVGPGKWVFNLGGWSPDQFADNKKPLTRDELDQFAPNNPVFLQFSRAETFLNSKAIEAIGLEKMKEPWILRDANGRATGVIALAGNGPVRDAAKFLDAPNGGRANLPMDVVRTNSLAMLHDLNKAGLTASGGGCQWEDLHREFQKEGKAGMRFFCFRTAPGGRTPAAIEQQIAAIPKLKYYDGDEWQDHTNWGERFAGGSVDDLYSPTTPPATQEAWDQWRRFAGVVASAGIQAFLHTQTESTIEGQIRQLEQLDREGISIRPLRWAFMHMEGVTVPQIERLRKLNVFIAVNPREMVTGGLLHRAHGDKAFAMPPLREIQESGIMWGLGTDAFEVNQYRPFQTLYWAVTGKMVGGTVVNTHTISREAALIGHTRSNAYLFSRENDLGSIQSGRLADLVVTDRDYLTVPADQIKDIKPVLTMIGGRIAYDAASEPSTATR